MEPQIQYAKTSDGVSIAYYAIGQGPAMLYLNMPQSHLEAEWGIDALRTTFTTVAQSSTLVRLDPRGFGLSDRGVDDFTVDGFAKDIEAVVDRLGFEKLRIYSQRIATVPALLYAARHPDKVTHLVQFPPVASTKDIFNERLQKLAELTRVDWDLASETMVRTLYADLSEQQIKDFTGLFRASVDPATFERLVDEVSLWNADADCASVSAPTLLIHNRNNPNFDMADTRRVAGLIKDSRVAFVNNSTEAFTLAQRFFEGRNLDLADSIAEPTMPTEAGAVRTILFTDVEGSTALTGRLGDAKARDLLREHERIVREALKAHGGSEVKTMGDGFMASFGSATKALECAITLQRAFAEHNDSADEPIKVRIGLNAGEPIAEDEDLFGTTVNMAARICARADGGQILAPVVVRELVAGKRFLLSDVGETELRGFEDPVRLYEVRWRE